MKISSVYKSLAALTMALICSVSGYGQNSAPAPGSGGAFTPNTGGFGNPNMGGPGFGGPPPMSPAWGGPDWGSPWGPGYYSSPSIIINTPTVTGSDVNAGTTKVLACGYDTQGIWRTIPLLVQYHYDGAQYKALVLNAWNPWTNSWNRNVDQPAYNTSYYLRGNTYDFYTNLSTGTYYFNL